MLFFTINESKVLNTTLNVRLRRPKVGFTSKKKENVKNYPSDMFSSAASLCSFFLSQHSFPINLALSVFLSAPIQPPDRFFDPDRCRTLEGLFLCFLSKPEPFKVDCSLTVTFEVMRLTFLRLLSGRPGLFSVKESDSGQEDCLALTEPLMRDGHRVDAVISSESLQLATEVVMFSLYSLASSKLDSDASIQHRLCSIG